MEGRWKDDIKELPWSESFVNTITNSILTDFASLRYELKDVLVLGGVVAEFLFYP